MASLFRRNNGYWYVCYASNGSRRWMSTGERCFGKAYTILQTSPSERDRRRLATINDFQKEFEEFATTNYSKGTCALYAHSLKAFRRTNGNKPMQFFTSKDVERYKSERLKTVSPVSVNVEFRTLKTAFNTALRWGLVNKNVFTLSKQLRVPIKEPAYVTKEEFSALLQLIEGNDFRDLLVFAVSTMMRRGEIVNLEWKDIDFERRLINVRSRGNFTVKGLRPRAVPVSDVAYNLLVKRKNDCGFVFKSSRGYQLKGASVSQKFKHYVRKGALSEDIHFHSLRHTGATWLIQRGVPLYSVQKILGHTTPEMTQIYSHLSDQNLRQAIEQMDFHPTSPAMN